MVNLRVVARGARERPVLPSAPGTGEEALTGRRSVWFADPAAPVDCAVYARERLKIGDVVAGPAVIEEHSSTTLLWPGDEARVAAGEELIVAVGGAA
jgi:N-methylhydantoinase A